MSVSSKRDSGLMVMVSVSEIQGPFLYSVYVDGYITLPGTMMYSGSKSSNLGSVGPVNCLIPIALREWGLIVYFTRVTQVF